MRRVTLLSLGLVLIVVGAAASVFGAVLIGMFGTDGSSSTGPTRITSSAGALVTDPARFDGGLPAALQPSEATVSATSGNSKPIFVGVGPARDVLTYLAGTPYDVVTGIDGVTSDYQLRRVTGKGAATAPANETIWTDQATGDLAQSITIDQTKGPYLVVVMNANASRQIDVATTVGVSAPWVFPLAVGSLVGGVIVLGLGAFMLGLGARRSDPETIAFAPMADIEAPRPAWARTDIDLTGTTPAVAIPEQNEPAPSPAADSAWTPPQAAEPEAPIPADDPRNADTGPIDLVAVQQKISAGTSSAPLAAPQAPPREPSA